VYRFVIEVSKRSPSKLLARLPAAVDFEPALEWARFSAARENLDAGWLLTADPEYGSIKPQWYQALGRPYVEGLRAVIPCGRDKPASYDIPLSYFSKAVSAVSALLILQDKLSLGEWFDYNILAYPQPCRRLQQSTGFCVERAERRAELEDRSLDELLSKCEGPASRARAIGGSGAMSGLGAMGGLSALTDVPVFIPRSVLRAVAVRARRAGAKETGGILIGHLRRDPSRPDLLVEVTAHVPARLAEEELASLTFTPNTWSDVDTVIDARGRNEIYLGWYHHHPATEWGRSLGESEQAGGSHAAGAFLSAEDVALHRTVFPRAWSVALLLCDNRHFVLFGWRHGMVTPRKFHVVHDLSPAAEPIEPTGANQHGT